MGQTVGRYVGSWVGEWVGGSVSLLVNGGMCGGWVCR